MSAHIPRRVFAAPFIITIAACAPDALSPQPAGEPSWVVTKNGEECIAQSEMEMSCPRGASCNPPGPMTYACPAAITQYPAKVVHHTGEADCKVQTTSADGMTKEDIVPCP